MKEKSFGGLWTNKNQSSAKAPKYLGSISLVASDIDALAKVSSKAGSARLNLAAWVNEKDSIRFLSIEGALAPQDTQPKPANPNLDEFF